MPDNGYPDTPECDKMLAAKDRSQPAGEFLEWLTSGSYYLALVNETDGSLMPTYESVERLLASWLGIDLQKVETERQAILEWVRAATPKAADE